MSRWSDTYKTEAVFGGRVRHITDPFEALCGYWSAGGWWGNREQVDKLPLCKECERRARNRLKQLNEILEVRGDE